MPAPRPFASPNAPGRWSKLGSDKLRPTVLGDPDKWERILYQGRSALSIVAAIPPRVPVNPRQPRESIRWEIAHGPIRVPSPLQPWVRDRQIGLSGEECPRVWGVGECGFLSLPPRRCSGGLPAPESRFDGGAVAEHRIQAKPCLGPFGGIVLRPRSRP